MVTLALSTGLGLLAGTALVLIALWLRDRRSKHYRGAWRAIGLLAGEGRQVRLVVAGIATGWIIAMILNVIWDIGSLGESAALMVGSSLLLLAAWTLLAIRVWRVIHRDD